MSESKSLAEFRIEADGAFGTLLLNRPDKLNALSSAMIDDVLSALDRARAEAKAMRIHALIIRSSTPKAFCVGADLAERLTMDEKGVGRALDRLRELMDGVAALEVPTLALIEGAAFGGGFELALACDLRVASPAASMGLTETRLAIIPGAGGTQRLSRLIGEARAKELVYTGRRLSAAEAFGLGAINMLSDNAVETAHDFAQEIAEGGPLALRAAKRAIDGGRSLPLSQALDHERACYQTVLESTDRIEGLKAFSEKRKPAYRGE